MSQTSLKVIPVSEVFAAQVEAELRKLNEVIISMGHRRDGNYCYVPVTDNPEVMKKIIPMATEAGWRLHLDEYGIALISHPDSPTTVTTHDDEMCVQVFT